ncbi:hypothetical protein IWW38_005311, partial [Coemansia aciculifera]
MDMGKLLEGMGDMKASTAGFCYGPLYGCYPPGTALTPAYAEMLLLRMATTLYNLDRPWGSVASLLSPRRVAGVSNELADRMLQVLRISSAYHDFFSLNTAEPELGLRSELAGLSTTMGRLMRRSFVHQPSSAAHLQGLSSGSDSALVELDFSRHVDLSIEWIREFVSFGQAFMPPQLLYTQVAATVERAVAFFVRANKSTALLNAFARITHHQWAALDSIRFVTSAPGLADGSNTNGSSERSALSIVYSIAYRLANMEQMAGVTSDLLDANSWQVTIAMCYPESTPLAYAVMIQCVGAARELVQVDKDGDFRAILNQKGINALKALQKTMAKDG